MELKDICLKKFGLKEFKKIIKIFFSGAVINEKIVFLECKKYHQYYVDNNLIDDCCNGLLAIIIYIISKDILENNLNNNALIDILSKAKSLGISACTNYVSPYTNIVFPLTIKGCFNYIGSGYVFDKCVVVGNNNGFYDKNYGVIDKNIKIGECTIFHNDCKVYDEIGKHCEVCDGCVVRERVPNDTVVKVRNNIQTKTSKNITILNSQKLMCYGCVPKYKNTLVIYGEGFYNPKIKFVIPYGGVDFSLSYWDKDKIILKINDVKMLKDDCRVTLVVFSRGLRISIINDFGVQKVLKNLKK